MALQKSEALVLKSMKQGETSKILTLYTRTFGKLKVIAKGARSSRSRFGGTLEPLNQISIVFYEKENRDLQTLSQADIIESFPKIRKNLEKTALAMACCELVDRIEVGVAPSPQLFRLLHHTLQGINDAAGEPLNFLRAFQVRLFDILGIKPNLTNCMTCERQGLTAVIFDIPHGGYLCDSCRQQLDPGMRLSRESIEALKILATLPLPQLNGQLRTVNHEVDDFLHAYLRYHVEGVYQLKALKFLNGLRGKLESPNL